jgi:hypothetical protein
MICPLTRLMRDRNFGSGRPAIDIVGEIGIFRQ